MSTDRADALRRRLARQRGLSVVDSTLAGVTSLDEGFRRTVATFPDRVAVRCEGAALSYRELDARVTELAGALDVDPAAPVGILLDRSIDMVAAALAVIRVGASYVPIDPATPPARVSAILADATPSMVITTSALADLVEDPVLMLDEPLPPGGLARRSTRDTRAYVIFTSGTTGRPKGVQVTHGNLLRLFTATEAEYGFGSSDVWTLFHSFAFDFSVWEMWGPLLYGGCLVIVPREVAKDPVAFRALLRDERVTMLSQTPTAFTQLIAEDARHADHLPLRWVVFGGEALHFSDLRPWVGKYGDTTPALANMYGITETTVHASFRRVRHADLSLSGSHIGIPLSDLDFTLAGSPSAGEPGEIVVTGPGVAMGYLNRPELTAERFVTIDGVSGYRSGDLATRLPNGEYVYHGRKDDQVKIRGFRIELGEVEGAIRAVPGVSQAAVVCRDLPGQGSTLVAYVVSGLAAADLRQRLAQTLPEYMIPARFEFLKSLPVNGNGKLDRAALPEPGQEHARVAAELMDPVTARVHAIVAGLLDDPSVRTTANFFELGGHSLLATRVLAEVREAFGVTMSLRDFLRTPSIAALAAAVQTTTAPAADGPLITLHPCDGNPAVGIPGVLGFGLSFAQLSAAMPDRPWYAVNLRDVVAARPGELTLPLLVSDIVDLVVEAAGGRPVHLVGHSYGGTLAHYLVTALRDRGRQVASLTLLDAVEPRDLAVELAGTRDHRVWEFLTNVASVFPADTASWTDLPTAPDPLARAQELLGADAAALFTDGLAGAFADFTRLAEVSWPAPTAISCRTLLVTATNPATATAEHAWNWLPLLRNGMEKREIAASHVGMVRAPHAQDLADLLTTFFADAETPWRQRKAS